MKTLERLDMIPLILAGVGYCQSTVLRSVIIKAQLQSHAIAWQVSIIIINSNRRCGDLFVVKRVLGSNLRCTKFFCFNTKPTFVRLQTSRHRTTDKPVLRMMDYRLAVLIHTSIPGSCNDVVTEHPVTASCLASC